MPDCGAVCDRENQGFDLYGAPPVDDEEWVCRNARQPEDHKADRLKPSFVHMSQFRVGELSVWRINDPSELAALAAKLKGLGHRTDLLLAAKAKAIRAVPASSGGRGLCVVNDTRTDDVGGHDDQHAAIAPCARLLQLSQDPEADLSALKAGVLLVFKASGISLEE